jgi:hypothetical protein
MFRNWYLLIRVCPRIFLIRAIVTVLVFLMHTKISLIVVLVNLVILHYPTVSLINNPQGRFLHLQLD